MLLQTNSYIVPKDKRAEHARLLRRFRASLAKLGCDSFEVYEQVGSNWTTGEPTGRYVQIMRFRDRRHQLAVQAAERVDPASQAIIAEFCQLINFPYQQQQGLFAVGFYNGVLPVAPTRSQPGEAAGATHEPEVAAPEGVDAEPQGPDDAEIIAGAEPGDPEAAAGEEGEGEDVEASFEDADESGLDEVATNDPETTVDLEADVAMPEELEPADAGVKDDETGGARVATPAMAPERRDGADVDGADADGADVDGAASDGAASDDGVVADVDVDELGTLLDAHLQTHGAGQASEADPMAGSQNIPDDAHEGLDGLDMDALDMPDDPASQPRHASKHAAR